MYEVRSSRGRVLWLIWLASVVLVTAPLFVSQIRAAGPQVSIAVAIGASLLPLALWLWHRLRTRWPHADFLVLIPAAVVCVFAAPLATAVVALFTCAAVALGSYVFERAGTADLPVATAAVTGFAVYSYALFGVGLAGGYYPALFIALIVFPLTALRRPLLRCGSRVRSALASWTAGPCLRSGFVSVMLFFAAGLAFLTAICAVTPTIVHDALMFHLALVKSYAASHSLTPPATIPYGYFPQGGELLMLAAYSLAGQNAAQMMEPVFFALALLTCVRIGMRTGTPAAGLIAAAVFAASVPFVHWTGSVLKNDLMLAAYVLASLDCVLAWFEFRRIPYLCCSAFLLAAAFGVKHIALFAAAPIGILWILAISKQQRKAIAAVAVIAIFAPLAGSWALRAWVATGNPTYPERASRAVSSPRSRTSYWARKIALPYTLQFEGQKHFESPSHHPLGFTLLFFLPLLVLLKRRTASSQARAVAFFTGTYLIYWAAVVAVLRYAIAPFIEAASVLGARAEALSRVTRTVAAAATYTLVFSVTVMVASEMRPAQVPYLLHRIGADEYLRRELPPYGAMRYLATHAGTDDAVVDIDAYAVAYGHNPARTHLLFRDPRQYSAANVRDQLQNVPDARWVVLPNAANAAELTAAVTSTHPAALAYRDPWFSVWWLGER